MSGVRSWSQDGQQREWGRIRSDERVRFLVRENLEDVDEDISKYGDENDPAILCTDHNSIHDGNTCSVWDYSECEGTEYCPPRCPRFVDEEKAALLIEPYESDQYGTLLDMYENVDSTSRTLGLLPSSNERRKEGLDHLTTDGWNLVAIHRNRIVGHVSAVPSDTDKYQFVVFVHQDYQNRGIGTELLKQLIAYADDRGEEALTLTVATGSRRAIHVYDNRGFDVIDRLESELAMRHSLEDPIVTQVQLPPAKR